MPRRPDEQDSVREIRCGECQVIFYLCRRHDRGNRYCSLPCRHAARQRSVARARLRYRLDFLVRLDQRDRQQRHAAKKRALLMDQGSAAVTPAAMVPAPITPPASTDDARASDARESDDHDLIVSPVAAQAVQQQGTLRTCCAVCGHAAPLVRTSTLRYRPLLHRSHSRRARAG